MSNIIYTNKSYVNLIHILNFYVFEVQIGLKLFGIDCNIYMDKARAVNLSYLVESRKNV